MFKTIVLKVSDHILFDSCRKLNFKKKWRLSIIFSQILTSKKLVTHIYGNTFHVLFYLEGFQSFFCDSCEDFDIFVFLYWRLSIIFLFRLMVYRLPRRPPTSFSTFCTLRHPRVHTSCLLLRLVLASSDLFLTSLS